MHPIVSLLQQRPYTIHCGDNRQILRTLANKSVQCCVTSPPYFGLRDYAHGDQAGMEDTPDLFVENLVTLFREVRRVLKDDGTVWLNLGDSFNAAGRKGHGTRVGYKQGTNRASGNGSDHTRATAPDLKPKDLIGIPWRVAFALQADGWYLRQDIIWSKPNPMPESVRDRCTKAHEYIFLLSKGPKYYFDSEAMQEPATTNAPTKHWRNRDYDQSMLHHKQANGSKGRPQGVAGYTSPGKRNRRSVWTVATKPYKGAHFATFPPELIRPCVLAGCPAGGVVLDPFAGSGTTGVVCAQEGRRFVGIELNPEYVALAHQRIASRK